MCCIFFFFRHRTAYEMRISYWSSDVCSSDLALALWIDDHLGDFLAVGDLVIRADADLGHGVIAGRPAEGGRLEAQDPLAYLRPPTGREGIILALDVEDQAAFCPRQQRRDEQADAFDGTGGGKGHDMLRSVMSKHLYAD